MTCGLQTRGLEETDPILQFPFSLTRRFLMDVPLKFCTAFQFQAPRCLQPQNKMAQTAKTVVRPQDKRSIWTAALAPSPGNESEQAAFPSRSEPGPLAVCVGWGRAPRQAWSLS